MRKSQCIWAGTVFWAALNVALAQDYMAQVYTNAAGETLPYRLLKPQTAVAGQKYPLVLFLHGAGERGTDNRAQLVHGTSRFLQPEARTQFPCFVVAPQCPTNCRWVEMDWGAETGVQPAEPSLPLRLTTELLDRLVAELPVDTHRLYVTGLSMGGYGTWDCITRYPDRFAAAVPVCGGGDAAVAARAARTPVWAFHSDDDSVVKVRRSRDMIAGLRAAGGQPHYFEYWGLGHNCWGKAYAEPELLAWMFAQRRAQPDRYELKSAPEPLPKVAQWPNDDAVPGVGPIQKADWFRQLWRQRRLHWWQQRGADKGAIVFLGDSITQGWGTLAQDFPAYRVVNRGIGGDVTRGVWYRLQEDVLDLEPRAVVLLIGTNDLGLGGTPEGIAENIGEILRALQRARSNLPVVLCRVMPRANDDSRFPEKIQRLNGLLDRLVEKTPGCVSCDTWSIFADDRGGAKKEEFPDLLHPNALGYAKWAEALRPLLARLP